MKKFILNISAGSVFILSSILISLIVTPYTLKHLTKEEFAIFHLLNTLSIWLGIVNMGQKGGFRIQLAANISHPEIVNKLSSTLLIFQFFVALLIILLGFLGSHYVISFFDIDTTYLKDAQYTFILLSISFALSLLSNLFSNILSVYNRDYLIFSGRTVLSIFQAALLLFFLSNGFKILALSFSIMISEILFLCYGFLLVSRTLKHIHFNFNSFDSPLLKTSLSLGKWFTLGVLAQLFINHTNLMLIGKLVSLETVTAFILTSKLYVIAYGIVQMIIKVASPQLIKISRLNNTYFLRTCLLLLKFVIGFLLVTGTSIFLINESFLNWWIRGKFYLGNSINILLLFIFFFNSINILLKAVLTSNMALKGNKVSSFIEGITNLMLSLLLGYYFGLPGILWATLIAAFFVSNLYLSYSSLNLFDQKFFPYIKKETLIISVFVISSVLFTYILSSFIIPNPFINFIFIIPAIVSLFLLLFYKDFKRMITSYEKE